jgi:5-methylcytosine-specific restriction endonuclease McrA
MNHTLNKMSPKRLDPVQYAQLRSCILHRDSWHCQFCGSMKNLEVHHQQFRSQSGNDHEDNLITLCVDCHSAAHCRRRIKY